MPLYIFDCDPASTADIERGCAVALLIFNAAGLSAAYCDAQMQLSAEDAPHDKRAVDVWRDADLAAIDACCDGWERVPPAAHLEYRA